MSQNNRSIFVDESNEISILLKEYYKEKPYGKKKYYGATRVLSETKSEEDKEILQAWRNNVGEEKAEAILQESMKFGNSLDMMVEKYLQPGFDLSQYDNEVGKKLFLQMQPILDKLRPVGMQVHLYSDKYRVQGYVDAICYMRNEKGEYELTIVDFKNSRKKKNEDSVNDYALQVSIYAILLYHMTGIFIKKLAIIVAVRNELRSQIFRFDLKDYIVEANCRISEFNKKRK